VSTCHRRKAGQKRCRVGTMSLATSCDRERKRVGSGSGSGSGAGGVRRHSSEGVAEERRGGGSGSGRQAGAGSGSGRRAGVGSVRGSPYNATIDFRKNFTAMDRTPCQPYILIITFPSAIWQGKALFGITRQAGVLSITVKFF